MLIVFVAVQLRYILKQEEQLLQVHRPNQRAINLHDVCTRLYRTQCIVSMYQINCTL